ncbi:hypothetical protein ACLB2K_053939 [Fragaria x ananassa]
MASSSSTTVPHAKKRTGYAIVEPAHMVRLNLSISFWSWQNLQDAFNSCVEQGVNRVIVSPLFLLPRRHWNQDIPSLTAAAAKEHPGVSYMVTAPLGLHPLLVANASSIDMQVHPNQYGDELGQYADIDPAA